MVCAMAITIVAAVAALMLPSECFYAMQSLPRLRTNLGLSVLILRRTCM